MAADVLAPIILVEEVKTEIQQSISFVDQMISKMMSVAYFTEIIGIIVMIGLCVYHAFSFFIEFFTWIFYFLKWLILPWPADFLNPHKDDVNIKAGFICWLIRYIIVIAYKVTSLPKCFLWYFLDTAGWVIYLPFKFVFWLLDWLLGGKTFESGEKNVWYFLDEIDYFLHGKPKDNYFMFQYDPREAPPVLDASGNDVDAMNLGFHIIHFPDSVMYQCYSINPYSLANLAPFPVSAFQAFIKCATNPF
jgi:hypothetical protein